MEDVTDDLFQDNKNTTKFKESRSIRKNTFSIICKIVVYFANKGHQVQSQYYNQDEAVGVGKFMQNIRIHWH